LLFTFEFSILLILSFFINCNSALANTDRSSALITVGLRKHRSVQMTLQVVLCVVVATQDMVAVTVDSHICADAQVGRSDELVVLVHVLVLVSAEEGALDDPAILNGGLVHRDTIV